MCSRWKAAAGPTSAGPPTSISKARDQHRGWFQSSLLESCGTRGRAPFNAVLTHGFTMDAKGMKMSKSLGNTISPLDLMKEHGADILRLWALSVDFTEDHRIGKEILGGVADQYRKLRNTFRYLLGALADFREEEKVGVEAMPELELYMLHLTAELEKKLRQAVNEFDFNSYTRLLADFANNDLSRLLFRYPQGRPLLRGERGDAASRRTSAAPIARCSTPCSTRWCAGSRRCWCSPARRCGARVFRTAGRCTCSNGRRFRTCRLDDGRWQKLRELRAQVTETIEPLRREKIIGSSLEAVVTVPELLATPDAACRAVHRLVSDTRRCAYRGRDRQPQVRALLALPAGSRGRRRAVRAAARTC